MRRFGGTAALLLAGVFPAAVAAAQADDLPARKPGLWEVKTSMDSHGAAVLSVQQCIDAATDQMMMSSTGPIAQAACAKRDVRRSGDTTTIDSTCSFMDKTATVHTLITGSLDSAYTMAVTAQSDAMPGGKMSMAVTAKWLGACTADQKPGDIVMAGGLKLNILDMQKFKPSEGVLPAQPK
jgi:Protein of unknown function (DUF3617)